MLNPIVFVPNQIWEGQGICDCDLFTGGGSGGMCLCGIDTGYGDTPFEK